MQVRKRGPTDVHAHRANNTSLPNLNAKKRTCIKKKEKTMLKKREQCSAIGTQYLSTWNHHTQAESQNSNMFSTQNNTNYPLALANYRQKRGHIAIFHTLIYRT